MKRMKGLHAPKWKFRFEIHKTFYWRPYWIFRTHLMWKEKWGTPRVEMEPKIQLDWFWFLIEIYKDETECEWWLWLHKFNKGNLREALSSWSWRPVKSKT